MRKFMVVLDDSRECLNAMRFAAMRAARSEGGVVILSIIPPEEFNHWIGVGDIMREEARERVHAHFEVLPNGCATSRESTRSWRSARGSQSRKF